MKMKCNNNSFWLSVGFCPTGDGYVHGGVLEHIVKEDIDAIDVPSFQDNRIEMLAQQLVSNICSDAGFFSSVSVHQSRGDEKSEPAILTSCQGQEDFIGRTTKNPASVVGPGNSHLLPGWEPGRGLRRTGSQYNQRRQKSYDNKFH